MRAVPTATLGEAAAEALLGHHDAVVYAGEGDDEGVGAAAATPDADEALVLSQHLTRCDFDVPRRRHEQIALALRPLWTSSSRAASSSRTGSMHRIDPDPIIDSTFS